ncbi:MAG: MmcQ/YjbR family DNA-binding protein [Fimbriimonas sp.]|nr:MmcQ/YjbR family DNA-binding protein [Fimbriimonas sp.]
MVDDLSEFFEPIRKILAQARWPGVEEGLSYGTAALKLKGKLLCRMREPDVLVLRCELDEKEFLIQSAPEIYFETDHYKGYSAILVRLEAIDAEELKERIEKYWTSIASKKMLDEYWSRSD